MKIIDNGKHLDFGEWRIPELTKSGLECYLLYGVEPGSFLTMVLEGDVHAILSADEHNRAHFHDIIAFLHNEAPYTSWGSPEKMKSYMEKVRAYLESQNEQKGETNDRTEATES